MFIKSLSSIGKHTVIPKYLITLNYKKMSTLENVIDGFNDVKSRIKTAIQKREQVPNHNLFLKSWIICFCCCNFYVLGSFRAKTSCC